MKDNKGLRLLTYVTGLVIGNSASVGVAQVSCAFVGELVSVHVIPRPHEEVERAILV
jgi:microcompartment protein CcmL/EutN